MKNERDEMSCMCKREREGKRARGGTVVACQVITLLHGELHCEERGREMDKKVISDFALI